eukprot:scaffold1626_cov178-Alexandrium_tamarense.AAC.3
MISVGMRVVEAKDTDTGSRISWRAYTLTGYKRISIGRANRYFASFVHLCKRQLAEPTFRGTVIISK